MNQLEETLGGWVRFLFVAFTGRVENGRNTLVATCPGAEHAAIACISLFNVGFAFTKVSRSKIAIHTERIRAVCDDEHYYRVLCSLSVCWHTTNEGFEVDIRAAEVDSVLGSECLAP